MTAPAIRDLTLTALRVELHAASTDAARKSLWEAFIRIRPSAIDAAESVAGSEPWHTASTHGAADAGQFELELRPASTISPFEGWQLAHGLAALLRTAHVSPCFAQGGHPWPSVSMTSPSPAGEPWRAHFEAFCKHGALDALSAEELAFHLSVGVDNSLHEPWTQLDIAKPASTDADIRRRLVPSHASARLRRALRLALQPPATPRPAPDEAAAAAPPVRTTPARALPPRPLAVVAPTGSSPTRTLSPGSQQVSLQIVLEIAIGLPIQEGT